MRLKDYQQDAVDIFTDFYAELKRQKAEVDKLALVYRQIGGTPPRIDFPGIAWQKFTEAKGIPEDKMPQWVRRSDSCRRPIPHVCLKIPTGGGKTLLGAAVIERMRPQNGLLLWIMPSRAIFRQTWQLLAHRMSPYRQTLERACGGRVKLFKKDEPILRLDVENYLCVMPIMLQASSGKKRKDFLKIFRNDSKYPQFFPEPDDKIRNDKFLEEHPDLDRHDLADDGIPRTVKHSLYNALKVIRPIIVLDEAHNAYSEERRKDLCRFNPRFILELSATPTLGVSNILVDIPGISLKKEEMIKLPLNIHNIDNADWKYTLSRAKEKRDALEEEAKNLQGESGRYIRPIMLIRAERVGKDQYGGEHIHAKDVRDYLLTELNVREEHIREKTAEKDELGGEDLLSPYSPVRYIITKDALREGWDCSFAYVLVLLDRTKTNRAITQMTGRILRQPGAQRTECAPLDECYLYCFDQDVGEAANNVKKGLEEEGMADLGDFIRGGENGGAISDKITIHRREQFRGVRIFLPRVLSRMENGKYRPLDYARDVLSQLNWGEIADSDWGISSLGQPDEIIETIHKVDLGFSTPRGYEFLPMEKQLAVEFFARRLHDVSPNSWISARAALCVFDSLMSEGHKESDIFDHRVSLSETLKRKFVAHIDGEAEKIFSADLQSNKIRFELIADADKFELPQEFNLLISDSEPTLVSQGREVKKSLFSPVFAKFFNGLERQFALHIDSREAVTWWHRMVARHDYALQGWRRHRVYPDFVVCVAEGEGDRRKVLVLETKGLHLAGNLDSDYKERLFRILESVAPYAKECGELELRRDEKSLRLSLRMLFQDSYKEEFDELLRDSAN